MLGASPLPHRERRHSGGELRSVGGAGGEGSRHKEMSSESDRGLQGTGEGRETRLPRPTSIRMIRDQGRPALVQTSSRPGVHAGKFEDEERGG